MKKGKVIFRITEDLRSAEVWIASQKTNQDGKMAIIFASEPTDAKKKVPKMESKIIETVIGEEKFSGAIETQQKEPIGEIDYLIQADFSESVTAQISTMLNLALTLVFYKG